jgi:hypothetical protein
MILCVLFIINHVTQWKVHCVLYLLAFVCLCVDGYLLDAVKHVTEDFIAYFSTNIRAYAISLGKNNFIGLNAFH